MKLREDVRVLYHTDPTAFQILGGAEIQMQKTKAYLEKMSVHVKFFDIYADKLADYDIFHVFNMRSDCLAISRLAKIKRLRLVLSPIYWPEVGEKKRRSGLKSRARSALIKACVFLSNMADYKYPTAKALYPFKDHLDLADIVLPNSKMEAATLSREFRTDAAKLFPVPNAVEKSISTTKPALFIEKHGLEDFVLFVGRIEPRKNLLTLLKAYRDIDIPLVIIGHVSPWQHKYFLQCQKMMRQNRNIHFLGFIPPHSEQLLSAYAAAKVFVLPSWFETPGLSSLEAGLLECNLVLTRGGSTTEYFEDYALYADPSSAEDIREKILEAHARPKDGKLREHIMNNYTWERAAEKTSEAYARLLGRGSRAADAELG